MNVHGYEVTEFTTGGDEPVDMVKVDLREDGAVVLSKRHHDPIEANANSPSVYRQNLLDYKAETLRRWRAERGPDSDLGRNIEQGTPPSSHGE